LPSYTIELAEEDDNGKDTLDKKDSGISLTWSSGEYDRFQPCAGGGDEWGGGDERVHWSVNRVLIVSSKW
jgi:hypothetical protein